MRSLRLPKYIQAYYGETGRYNYFQKLAQRSGYIYRRHHTRIINKTKKVSPIKLASPLQTVFFIAIRILGFSLCFLILCLEWSYFKENRRKVKMQTFCFWSVMCCKFKKLRQSKG